MSFLSDLLENLGLIEYPHKCLICGHVAYQKEMKKHIETQHAEELEKLKREIHDKKIRRINLP